MFTYEHSTSNELFSQYFLHYYRKNFSLVVCKLSCSQAIILIVQNLLETTFSAAKRFDFVFLSQYSGTKNDI